MFVAVTKAIPSVGFTLEQLPPVLLEKGSFVTGLGVFLLLSLQLSGGLRKLCGAIGIISLYAEIYLAGRSGISLIDFGMPALAMLVTLNLVDAFFLRPVAQTKSWSAGKAVAHIFGFPNETPSKKNSPIAANLQAIVRCSAKYLVVNMLLYVIPNPNDWNKIKFLSAAYFFHSIMVGFAILFSLGSFIEIVIRSIGIASNVEMNPMFNNPNGASNIREFWARWNLAIKNGLSRVFFHSSAPPAVKVKADDPDADYEEALTKYEITVELLLVELRQDGQRMSARERDLFAERHMKVPKPTRSNIEKKLIKGNGSSKSKRKPLLPKAASAVVTFLASGLFHEAMNAFAFPQPRSGETVAFFLVHGLATVFYSWIERFHPTINRRVPSCVGVMLVNMFLVASAPLFTAVFLHAGFFEQFKSFGIFGPVHDFYWVFGDGYGGHLDD